MKIITSINATKKITKKICIAAGFFDGVHIGHRKLIKTLKKVAEAAGAEPWVLTFKEHPLRSLNPKKAPLLITSFEHKLLIFKRMHIAGCIALNFSSKLAKLEPEAFIRALLRKAPNLHTMVIGDNWTFGKNAVGTAETLKELSQKYNFKVVVLPPVRNKKEIVSSTLIRQMIAHGDIKRANRMLGRPYSLFGKVVHGLGFGERLGFPTANIEPFNEVFPPEGVYAAITEFNNRFWNAVVSIGKRPTLTQKMRDKLYLKRKTKIEAKKPVIELHVLDEIFHKETLYNKKIEIFFIKHIREQKKFSSIDLLRDAIKKDIIHARKILKGFQLNFKYED